MGAAIHAQRAADAARNAAIEGEAGDAGIGRGARDLHVGHGGAGAEPASLASILISPKPLPPSRITTPAMPPSRTSRLEPSPMMVTGMSDRRVRQEISEVGLVGRRIENLGRTADAEPGEIGKHGAGLELAAQLRELRGELARKVARDLCLVHAPGSVVGELLRQRVDPVGDGAGAKPDHEVAGLRQRRDGLDQPFLAVDGQHLGMAVAAQARGKLIAVDAGDRHLARRIDRRHERNVGVVEAGGEFVEQGFAAACSGAAGSRR